MVDVIVVVAAIAPLCMYIIGECVNLRFCQHAAIQMKCGQVVIALRAEYPRKLIENRIKWIFDLARAARGAGQANLIIFAEVSGLNPAASARPHLVVGRKLKLISTFG